MPQVSPAAPARSLGAVARLAEACTACPLHAGRSRVVFGDGDPAADLLFVGEAPGRHEEVLARPYVGAVGNLLDNLLADNGLRRDAVYVTTLVKCRPPGRRGPEPGEVDSCARFLREQLQRVNPRVVVALGALATRVLLGRDVPLGKVAGYRFPIGGATLVPTYDPADAVAGSPLAMAALKRDVRIAAGVVAGRIAAADEALDELRAARARAHPAGHDARRDGRGPAGPARGGATTGP